MHLQKNKSKIREDVLFLRNDWLRYELTRFDFIITRDRKNNINTFQVIETEGSGDLHEFDPTQNGLYHIHIKIDANRFASINFDVKPEGFIRTLSGRGQAREV
ncbi:Rieske iron-sulfur domain-containing protein [Penicillium taxi]|uniref:Rieske iron-sulfur domain-containing protein n=1 Tax=Penicillium taxi TaxID=168475 RepID=UPI00254596FE|nr:Rieske iron-sulfur domain-containing protein [Penicillium taxi]KAJ5893412.1 Rieske iron-sulfur domain-containing protein [Penicillium taxi]